MELMRTLKFKVREPTNRKTNALKRTIREWNNCVNFHVAGLRDDRTQKELYEQAKTKWSNLNTGLVQTARDEAKAILEQQNESEQVNTDTNNSYSPMRFDKRTATIEDKDGLGLRFGMSLVSGREYMPILGGERNQEILEKLEFEFQGVLLQYSPDTGEFYVHVQIKEDREIPAENDFDVYVGVDLGLDNIAVCSAWTPDGNHLDSLFINGNELLEKRSHYFRVRRSMQENGHDGSRLKGKEAQYVDDKCHKISRQIVDFSDQFEGNVCIVMEKLDGIRDTMKGDRHLHSWPFGQIQEYIQYKAHEVKIAYRTVNPRGTSSYCGDCMSEVKVRDRFLIECINCGRIVHRDHEASRNIVQRLWFYMNDNTGHCESGPEQVDVDGEPMFARSLNESPDSPESMPEAHVI